MRFPLVFILLPAIAVLAAAQPAAAPLTSLLSGDHLTAGGLQPGRRYVATGRFKVPAGGAPVRLAFRVMDSAGTAEAEAAATIPGDGQWHPARGIWLLPPTAPVSGLRLSVAAPAGVKLQSDGLTVYPVLTGLFNADDPAAIRQLGAEGVRLIFRCSEVAENLAAAEHPGHWEAAEEAGRPVVRQTSPYLWTRIGLGSPEWRDYALAVGVRPDQSNEGAAVILRVCDRGADGCAEVELTAEGIVVRALYPGATQILAHARGGLPSGQFSAWRLLARDGVLTVEREGRGVLTLRNPIFSAGAIGLATRACAASFSDLSVRSLTGGGTLLAAWPADGWRQTDARPFERLLGPASTGVPIVFTINFGERSRPQKLSANPNAARAPANDELRSNPVPIGPAAEADLRIVERFLIGYGRFVSVFSVENEPNYIYAPADLVLVNGTSRALEWMKTVAARVRATARSHPEILGRMTIAGPSLVSLTGAATDRNGYRASPGGRSFDAMLAWMNADPNIDLIDVHAHVASVAELQTCLDYICARAAKPLLCTEWSEAAADNVWITRPVDPAILAASALPDRAAIRTNDDYVRACYRHPVAKSEWDRFVAGSRLTPGFIASAARLFTAHGVVLNNYGGLVQYGSPRFDLKQLYANLTVVLSPEHQYQDNGTYPEQYRALSPHGG